MSKISAAAVQSLREKTGLPLMECKKALEESDGNQDAAVEKLRKQGTKIQETRIGRETTAGRLAVYTDMQKKVGAMIELRCESAPVANSPDFMDFAKQLAKELAIGPGANTADELLKQSSSTANGRTLGELKDELFNRMREVLVLGRVLRINGACGGYAHHDGSTAVLVEVEGGTPEVAKDVSMHVAAMSPAVIRREELPADAIDKEREILSAAAIKEGKPENIVAKMIEGRLKNFFAEKVLLEQPFVKDPALTVGKLAEGAKMKVLRFVRWDLSQ